MKKVLALGLALLCLLSFVSCGGVSNHSCLLSAGFTRNITENVSVTDSFETAASQFCFEFLKRNLSDSKNVLVSPLSAMYCLGMMASGADGQTKTQLETALGLDSGTLDKCLYAFRNELGDCVSVANSIWFRDVEALSVKNTFLQNCANWYASEIYAAPFDETTRRDINAWVRDKTKGMIDKILEDPISADAMLYLINAIAFDAKWETPFEKEKEGTFTCADGKESTVKMLCSNEYTYLEGAGFYGVAKNYKGRQYSFVGLLPTDSNADVSALAASLTGQAWEKLWQSKKSTAVVTRVPEFSYDCEMELNEVLEDMGIVDMFSPADANFKSMAEIAGGNIYCSKVKQKTFISLDKEGTKAAAVTWGEMKATSAGPNEEQKTVILDRPFLYAIVDDSTGIPLFVGVVNTL